MPPQLVDQLNSQLIESNNQPTQSNVSGKSSLSQKRKAKGTSDELCKQKKFKKSKFC